MENHKNHCNAKSPEKLPLRQHPLKREGTSLHFELIQFPKPECF